LPDAIWPGGKKEIGHKKSLNVSSGFFFEYGDEEGIDSLCSPCGQFGRGTSELSNRLKPVVEPGQGFSPFLVGNMHKKSLNVSSGSFFKYGGEEGIT